MRKMRGNRSCQLCNVTFKRRPDFSVHIITAHQELDGCFRCPDCDVKLGNWGSILKHYQVVHVGDKSFECVFCDKRYSYRGLLEGHIITHTKERTFACAICDKSYTSKPNLQRHTRSAHTGERPFQCSICDKRFTSRVNLINHQKIYSEATKVHQCSLCGWRFRSKSHLQTHFQSHDGLRPWKCEVCHMCFATPGNLRRHKATHDETRVKQFSCKLCDKKYFDLGGLTRHISSIHEKDRTSTEKRFQCSLCPKAYDDLSAWNNHKTVHLPLSMKPRKVPPCIFCGQRRTSKESFFRHLRCHLGEWLYACKPCGRKFYSWKDWRKHKKHHIGLKKSCVFCGKLYSATSNSLYVHLRNHLGERPFSCGVCSKDFSSGAAVHGHLKSHRSHETTVSQPSVIPVPV